MLEGSRWLLAAKRKRWDFTPGLGSGRFADPGEYAQGKADTSCSQLGMEVKVIT